MITTTAIFTSLLVITSARHCVDDKLGSCATSGWCFHNKTSGAFNCDEKKFCRNLFQMQNTIYSYSTGCFNRDGHTVCCCNDFDGCNVVFVQVEPTFAHTQKCYHAKEDPDGVMSHLIDCDDPWCYTMFTYRIDSGIPRLEYGCQSRALVKHNVFKDQYKKYRNNTAWIPTITLSQRPRCSDFARKDTLDGIERGCIDFNYLRGSEELRGRLCCCRGEKRCNQNFTMRSEAFEELDFQQKIIIKRKLISGGTEKDILWSLSFVLLVTLWTLQR